MSLRKRFGAFVCVCFLIVPEGALAWPFGVRQAVAGDSRNALTQKLEKAVKESGFKSSELGLWVGVSAPKGLDQVYGLNETRKFIPASLSKLVTGAAVLNLLEPTYKYKTQILSPAVVKDGILNGSLYLKGGGDPSFVSENLWVLVNELARRGFKTVNGDLVIDDSRFDAIRFPVDREKTRVDRAYDAPLGAMSLNWNAVNVFITPGGKAGEPLQVFIDPPNQYIRLKNEGRTLAKGKRKTVTVERLTQDGQQGDIIRVRGGLAVESKEVVFYKSIAKPDLWSGYNLNQFLQFRGITLKGRVITGTAPADAKVLASVDSKPLAFIVADMAKFSNNYVAEMLVKNLAAENGVQPATMQAGMERVLGFMDKVGLKRDEYTFVNASGLSRDNQMTPVQLGKVLEFMQNDFKTFPEYLMSLPMAGVDGTLKSRMKNSSAERWVRAKTGLLTGVVGLAGYAGQNNTGFAAFVFMYNGRGKEDKARQLFDDMAAIIAEGSVDPAVEGAIQGNVQGQIQGQIQEQAQGSMK